MLISDLIFFNDNENAVSLFLDQACKYRNDQLFIFLQFSLWSHKKAGSTWVPLLFCHAYHFKSLEMLVLFDPLSSKTSNINY